MKRYYYLLLVISLWGCSTSVEKKHTEVEQIRTPESEMKSIDSKPMANPVLIYGSDIGKVFNAYYKTGQTAKMVRFLNENTRKNYSSDQLESLLSKLDYGFEMKFSGMKKEQDIYVLNYSCTINATTVIKQLKVVVEADTARIIPSNLGEGKIFL